MFLWVGFVWLVFGLFKKKEEETQISQKQVLWKENTEDGALMKQKKKYSSYTCSN